MVNLNEPTIVINKGIFNVSCPKRLFVSAQATPEGVIFNFLENVSLRIDDPNMPIETRNKIEANSKIINGSLIFNLLNYATPVKIEIKS